MPKQSRRIQVRLDATSPIDEELWEMYCRLGERVGKRRRGEWVIAALYAALRSGAVVGEIPPVRPLDSLGPTVSPTDVAVGRAAPEEKARNTGPSVEQKKGDDAEHGLPVTPEFKQSLKWFGSNNDEDDD